MLFEVILLSLIVLGMFLFGFSYWLEDHTEYRRKCPKHLPDGWVQVPDMLVWEKTSDEKVYQIVLTKHGFYTFKVNGESLENFDADSTNAALFHADQRIRFGFKS